MATVFRFEWTNSVLNPQFASWVTEVPKWPSKAGCKLCLSTFNLSNMGRQALISHMKTKKHLKQSAAVSMSSRISSGVAKSSSVVDCSSATSSSASHQDVGTPSTSSSVTDMSGSVDSQSTIVSSKPSNKTVNTYMLSDEITKAEILWALKTISCHFSYRSAIDSSKLFVAMFPDSNIASKFSMGKTKLAYTVTHGLAPFFHQKLLNAINVSDAYVICFDEALNQVVQRGQMDIVVRFWDTRVNEVSSCYFNSAFMGHSTATDVVNAFQEATAELNSSKILQISMDGPNVNWSFLEKISTQLLSEAGEIQLLSLGSCALHVIHGSVMAGHKNAGWNVVSVLCAVYRLFKDSPARRSDFTSITGCTLFPLKFCRVRWVENVSVATRCLDVFPSIQQFMKKAKALPKTATAATVSDACADKLIMAKIAFFSSVCAGLEPFLKTYQTSSPIAPFLNDDIAAMVRNLMRRFIKRPLLSEASTHAKLVKIDVTSRDARLAYKEVDVGVAARKYLDSAEVSDRRKDEFRMQCSDFLSATVEKILERSPVKYKVVRYISGIVPATVASNAVLCEKRLKDLMMLLYEKGWITSISADRASLQVATLCTMASSSMKAKFDNFSRSSDRLDIFYRDILGSNPEFTELWHVFKLIFILSHGNASVESGFSVNNDVLVENMLEESVVAQRQVYHAVSFAGGYLNVDIDKPMLRFCRGARSQYQEALKKKREAKAEDQRKLDLKKRVESQVAALKAKKAKILHESTHACEGIDSEIKELCNLK